MRFSRACVESFGYSLPAEVVTSDQIEARLQPLYERLRLPEGRLEAMTGIRQRRVWPAGMLPSEQSCISAERAIEAAGIDRRDIGALLHGSVCRDHLEPATACGVHHRLGLGEDCLVYDLSNACLGLLTGVVQIASMIELGQIRAGLVVGTEDSRPLLETTIAQLNRDTTLTRQQLKLAIASLTIGSGSCAILLTDASLSRTGNHLRCATALANTSHHRLCHSGRDEAAEGGMTPLMQTDSETLMQEGIATGVRTFARFLDESSWPREQLDRIFCHQVGGTHRRLMLESLQLDPLRDYSTFAWLGNTGSVALPLTVAIGAQKGALPSSSRTAWLGIGSGINCLMLAAEWQETRVSGELPAEAEEPTDLPSVAAATATNPHAATPGAGRPDICVTP